MFYMSYKTHQRPCAVAVIVPLICYILVAIVLNATYQFATLVGQKKALVFIIVQIVVFLIRQFIFETLHYLITYP